MLPREGKSACVQMLADIKNDQVNKDREEMPIFLVNYLIRQVIYSA